MHPDHSFTLETLLDIQEKENLEFVILVLFLDQECLYGLFQSVWPEILKILFFVNPFLNYKF